jgi:hypothetical protein
MPNFFLMMAMVMRNEGGVWRKCWPCAREPLFDTRQYVVEFSDGTGNNYYTKVIAENMFAQVDAEGTKQYLLMEEIIDHRCDGVNEHGRLRHQPKWQPYS